MALEAVILGAAFGAPRLQMPQRAQQCVSIASSSSSISSQAKKTQRVSLSSQAKKTQRVQLTVRAAAAAAASSPSSVARHQREVALESEIGVSYEALRDMLAAGEWEAADAETRRLLCVLAGESAVKRKWVYFSEVQFIPKSDLKTVDGLWRAYSDNKFGYSVQRRLWKNVNGSWTAFFSKVSWTRPMPESRNNAYKKFPLEFMWDVADPTPLGHLPLTNALRGTQLLEKLLSHPALDFADDEEKLLLPDTDSLVLQPSLPHQQQQQQPQQQKGVYTDEDMTVDYGF